MTMPLKNPTLALQKFYHSKNLIRLLFAVGIFLRLRQYAFNRSLWLDEASVAVNFVTRSFADLFSPLLHHEIMPLGFLLAEKLAVQWIGPSEYALRLFPLAAGLAALFLFYRVAQRLLDPAAVPLALGIFAILQPLIYFSSEAKHYSFDILSTVVMLLLAVRLAGIPRLTLAQVLGFGLAGALTVWFSYPAVFVLAATALVLGYEAVRKERQVPAQLLLVFGMWLLSFLVGYLFSRRYLTLGANDYLQEFWKDGFMPLVPSGGTLQWFVRTFFKTFEYPGGFAQPGLAGLAFLAGVAGFRSQKKSGLGLLVVPIVLVLAASGVHAYPFFDRLIVFIIPLLVLLIAEGTVRIVQSLRPLSGFVSASFLALLLVGPLLTAFHHAIAPMQREEARPVIHYLERHIQPADTLYIYTGAVKAFDYYALVERFAPRSIVGVNSRNHVSGYLKDLAKLEGQSRVWVLFSHVWTSDNINERAFILNHLDAIGRRLDQFEVRAVGSVGLEASDAGVYLYDLRGKPED
jgi:hypothetical protein